MPFRYWGVRDTVDFEPIPWRNGRFDPQALTEAGETRERAQQALEEWREHGGGRTLAFCCSITHADFMADYFAERGVRTAAVDSGTTSAPRRKSLTRLASGDLDVLFSIDVFNEGVDVPEVDCVLMLRPTESPVVFIQQLGRGLRLAEGKDELRVVDFIGNHRSFLLKPCTLLSLGSRATPSLRSVVEALEEGDFELPLGCSVTYDLDSIDLLGQLARARAGGALEEYCRSHLTETGLRPTAMQAFRAGLNPRAARNRSGHWFGYLADLGLLGETEREVVEAHGQVLAAIEKEPITKAYKLTTLRAMLHDGTLRSGCRIDRLAETARRLTLADPRLTNDVTTSERPDPAALDEHEWADFWRRWPLEHFSPTLFRPTGERFEPEFAVAEPLGDTFDAMVAEIVEWRLAAYLLGKETTGEGAAICRVSHNQGRPLVFLDRARNPGLPTGETTFLANGEEYTGRFVKIALNTASRPGVKGIALHELLRGWIGPTAGQPGTNHEVRLEQREGRWLMAPVDVGATAAEVVPLWPNLEVACGADAESCIPSHTGGRGHPDSCQLESEAPGRWPDHMRALPRELLDLLVALTCSAEVHRHVLRSPRSRRGSPASNWECLPQPGIPLRVPGWPDLRCRPSDATSECDRTAGEPRRPRDGRRRAGRPRRLRGPAGTAVVESPASRRDNRSRRAGSPISLVRCRRGGGPPWTSRLQRAR